MDKQPKKQNNKTGRLLLMAVLAVIVIYAGARFTQSPQQPAAIAPTESAQPIPGGLTLLIPGALTDVIGIVLVAAAIVLQIVGKRRAKVL